jgi:hypothetical protein
LLAASEPLAVKHDKTLQTTILRKAAAVHGFCRNAGDEKLFTIYF